MSAVIPAQSRDETIPRSTLLEAVEQISICCGVDYDPLFARQTLLSIGEASSGFQRLGLALKDLGVRITTASLTLREAMEHLHKGVILVCCSQQNPDDWVVLVQRSGRSVRLPSGKWLRDADLVGRLGLSSVEEPIEWGIARSFSAMEGIGGPPQGPNSHGGDDHGGGHHGKHPLTRLWTVLRPEYRDLWVVAVFALCVGILSLAVPITVESIVSSVQGGNEAMYQAVVVLAIVLLFCLALAGIMRAWQNYVVELVQRRIFVRVVNELAYRLPRVKLEAFDREHGPELVNRFFDVLTVQKASATLLLDGVAVLMQALVGLAVLAVWHPYLLTFDLVVFLGLLLIIWLLGTGAVRAKIKESLTKYAVAGWMEEMVRHPLAFKMAAGQDYAMDRADERTREYLYARRDSFRIVFRQIIFGIGMQAAASAFLLGLGGFLVIGNELTIGQLVAAELILTVMIGSFVKLGKTLESYYELMAGVDKLGHLLDLPLETESGIGKGEHLPMSSTPAGVQIQHLNYAYADGHDHTEIFHDLSMEIKPGERIALVGPSGSGKTTLMELLNGLRQPTGGCIKLDGIDLRDIRLESLRDHVVSVAGAEAFVGTVIDNVRLGRPEITLTDVRDALVAVGLLDDIQRFPRGLHTQLSTGGAPLSHGQVHRLMLARAIAGNPRLLLLDETLDYLDAPTRRQLTAVLFNRNAPWTLVLITHNAEMLEACDRVFELPGNHTRGLPSSGTGH